MLHISHISQYKGVQHSSHTYTFLDCITSDTVVISDTMETWVSGYVLTQVLILKMQEVKLQETYFCAVFLYFILNKFITQRISTLRRVRPRKVLYLLTVI